MQNLKMNSIITSIVGTEDDTFMALKRMPFEIVYKKWMALCWPKGREFVVENGWDYNDFDIECNKRGYLGPRGVQTLGCKS